MTRQLAWLPILLTLVPPATGMAADGLALLNRMHVGRVKAVDPSGRRLVIEGMFHDRTYREISVSLEPDTAILNPDLMDRTRPVVPGEIRPGYYVALECVERGKRHIARKVTITSTEEEDRLQRALMKGKRADPPELRGSGGGPAAREGPVGSGTAPWRWMR